MENWTQEVMWSVAASSSADEVDRRAAVWGPFVLPNKGGFRSSILCCQHVTFSPWWSRRRRISWRSDWKTSNWRFESLYCWGTCLVFWVSHQQYASGGGNKVNFRVLPFRIKIQGLALIGCAWRCPYWRHCFESGDYLHGENPRFLIGRWRRLCTVSFLGALLLESVEFCLGGGCIGAARAEIP
jgi:hypothetical protein